MSAWYGLQNHEAHIDDGGDAAPECFDCESMCLRSMLCRCCLQAEVERLTAALAERDRRIAEALNLMGDRANSSPGYPLLERVLRGESA